MMKQKKLLIITRLQSYLLLCLPHQLETLKIINKYHFINKKKFNIEYIYI